MAVRMGRWACPGLLCARQLRPRLQPRLRLTPAFPCCHPPTHLCRAAGGCQLQDAGRHQTERPAGTAAASQGAASAGAHRRCLPATPAAAVRGRVQPAALPAVWGRPHKPHVPAVALLRPGAAVGRGCSVRGGWRGGWCRHVCVVAVWWAVGLSAAALSAAPPRAAAGASSQTMVLPPHTPLPSLFRRCQGGRTVWQGWATWATPAS